MNFEQFALEFEARISLLNQRVLELEAEVLKLSSENAELKARLNLNSRNSSRPPSSDLDPHVRFGEAQFGDIRVVES